MNRRDWIRTAGGTVVGGLASAVSGRTQAQLVQEYAEELKNGEFNWFPDRSPTGPLLIIVSIPDQLLHVYRNGIRVAASTCSTGKPGHATPTGVFTILQKDRNHHSSTYNNAPMPNMNRLTWSGIALHAGNLPGYPASHGCVRLPLEFSALLYSITTVGMVVVIADDASQPSSVVHPGMVLGDYARQEFASANTALKQSAYSEGHADKPQSTSVVVSRPDQAVSVFSNGDLIAQGKAAIENPSAPIGNKVYVLNGVDEEVEALHWISASADVTRTGVQHPGLQRVSVDPQIREVVRQNMHQGMSIVTADAEQSPQTRSSSDFVVLGSAGLY